MIKIVILQDLMHNIFKTKSQLKYFTTNMCYDTMPKFLRTFAIQSNFPKLEIYSVSLDENINFIPDISIGIDSGKIAVMPHDTINEYIISDDKGSEFIHASNIKNFIADYVASKQTRCESGIIYTIAP